MASILNAKKHLQEAEYPKVLVPVATHQGTYTDRNNKENHLPWVHLDCVSESVHANATSLGLELDELPTYLVKVKNPDNRDWESVIGEPFSTATATVVAIVKESQVKSLALSIDAKEI